MKRRKQQHSILLSIIIFLFAFPFILIFGEMKRPRRYLFRPIRK